MSRILTDFFRHNLWANERLLDACAGLSEAQLDATVAGTEGSIRSTLMHIVGAEHYYVRLMTGRKPAYWRDRDGWVGVEALKRHARTSGRALTEIAGRARPGKVFSGVVGGERYADAIETILVQVVNHGNEHRAQVATILTQQGVEPPCMDGWLYGEAKAKGELGV